MWKCKPKINLEIKKNKAQKVAAAVSPSVRQHFCRGECVEAQAYIPEQTNDKNVSVKTSRGFCFSA